MSINMFVYQECFSLFVCLCLSRPCGFYLLLALLLTSSASGHFGAAVNRREVSQTQLLEWLHCFLTCLAWRASLPRLAT